MSFFKWNKPVQTECSEHKGQGPWCVSRQPSYNKKSKHLYFTLMTLRWRHNGLDSVSNHQPPGCLLNRLIRRSSKKRSKRRVTGLCAGNSPGTGEFSAQMASYAENVSIWWTKYPWLISHIPRCIGQVSEWVIKFNGLSRIADSEVRVIHINRVIIIYTWETSSFLT